MNKVEMIFRLQSQSQYNLQQQTDFKTPSLRSVDHSSKSILYLGPKTWNLIPSKHNQQKLNSFISFKKAIRNCIV